MRGVKTMALLKISSFSGGEGSRQECMNPPRKLWACVLLPLVPYSNANSWGLRQAR